MNKIIPLFHMSVGDVLRIGLMGVFVVICIALAIIILMQAQALGLTSKAITTLPWVMGLGLNIH